MENKTHGEGLHFLAPRSVLNCFKENSALPRAGVRAESEGSGSIGAIPALPGVPGDQRKWLISSFLNLEKKRIVESMDAWQSLVAVAQRCMSSSPSDP